MKRPIPVILAFVFGALPFLIGCIQNWYMLTYVDTVLPYGLISFAVLLLWGCIAFLLNTRYQKTKVIVISLNLIAAFNLVLLGIQELVFHAYWANSLGRLTQYFYLPMLSFGFSLTNWSHRVFTACVASFALMIAVSMLGCKLREKFH